MNINLLLSDLGNNQEAFVAIAYTNTLNETAGYNVNLFTENHALPIIRPNSAVLPIEKGLYADGITISTSLSTAKYLKNCIASTKILYVWEPEWIFSQMEYIELYNILNTKAVLIAQNQYHAEAIANLANRKVDKVIPNFDLVEIIKQCNLQ